MAISNPPPLSKDWTIAERCAYAAWCAQITMERIDRDDPTVPVVSKAASRWMMHAIHAVLTWPAEKLEANRAALEKPRDDSRDRPGILLPTATMELLKRASVEAK